MKQLIIILSAVALLFTGCKLDYAPENTIVDENVYKEESTAEAALLGAYVQLDNFLSGAPQGTNGYPPAFSAFCFGDLGTDNLKAQASVSDYLAMETSEYTSTQHNGMLSTIYTNGYNAIDYACNIIDGISKYGKYSEAMMNQHIAEAKFIRAYAYFQLLIMFGDQALQGNDEGLGLVMHLSPYEGYNPDNVSARSSNITVWNQIISDLKDNLDYLPTTVPDIAKRVRANQTVAKALLSRIYLYKGTYNSNKDDLQLAAQYARDVLGTSGYTFTTDSLAYQTLYPRNLFDGSTAQDPQTRSSEIIFFEASRLTTDAYPSGIYNYYNKKSFYVPETMKSYYDAHDVRGFDANANGADCTGTDLLGIGSSTYYPTNITSMKYTSYNTADGNNDVIYIRLAEMKLTLAEALARVNGSVSDEAVGLLNDVHQRAFAETNRPAAYTVADFASTEDFIKTVLKERNRELAYENHQRYDLIRTHNLLQDATLGAVAPTKWNAPIPDHEVTISGGVIKQNTGY
jgi:hypothetical protein